MKLNVMLDDGAKMPSYAHATDAGMDLYSREFALIETGGSHFFDTGVHIEIPEGYVGMVKAKSGLNKNSNLVCTGVVDSGYTGSIGVKLYNHGYEDNIAISRGQKIAQLVIMPVITAELELVTQFEHTERGDGGYGSSGAF